MFSQGIFLRHLNEHVMIQMLKYRSVAGACCTELIDQDPVGITGTLVLIPDPIEGNMLVPGTCTGCSHFTDI